MSSNYDIAFIIGGLFLSLCIFSLILGDNYLFRLGSVILSSVVAAYSCVLLVEQYFLPILNKASADIKKGDVSSLVGFFVLLIAAILLFCQFWFRKREGGHAVQVIIIAISASVMIVGAVNGSLPMLIKSLTTPFRIAGLSETDRNSIFYWIQAGMVLICAIAMLLYTQHYHFFGHNEGQQPKRNNRFGEILIGFTFGAITAAIFLTSAEILVNHLSGWIDAVKELLLFK